MIAEAPLAPAARLLRRGTIDPVAYLAERRSRFEAVEDTIHAFVEPPDWAGLEAGLEARFTGAGPPAARPPLWGIPVGVKDIVHVEGHPTRAGSGLPPEALGGPQATVVDRLEAAGAYVFGKTHTTEFAYSSPGPTRNPHDPAHTPGGSSSGSAAAVAAGVCPLALGSQTVGSVIRPASFCGVVGFKPSYGRVPTDGVIPLSTSVDHVGAFAQDAAGVGLAAAVLCTGWRSMPSPDGPPVLGVPEGPYLEQATAAGLEAFEATLERLEAAGYDVRRLPAIDDIAAINDRHESLVAADAALAHHAWFAEYGDRYAAETAELIEEGRSVGIGSVATARAGRLELRERLHEAMVVAGIDLWVSPASTGPAPEGIDDTGDPVMNLPWTHAGLPAVSLPGATVDGLPVGLQVAAAYDADEDLLARAPDLSETVRG